MLQGNWISSSTLFYGDTPYEIGIASNQKTYPFQVKNNTYRLSLAGKLFDFDIQGNCLLLDTDTGVDTVYINLLKENELKISFRHDKGYDQYYFKK